MKHCQDDLALDSHELVLHYIQAYTADTFSCGQYTVESGA